MVPTGTWKFFFTSGLSTAFINPDHRTYKGMEGPTELLITFDESHPAESTVKISINGFNELFVDDNLANPINQMVNCPIKPRMRPFWEQQEDELIWSIPISIWGKWIYDEDERELKCFDQDWEVTKDRMWKDIRNNPDEQNKMQQYLRPFYKQIRWAYRHHSS